MLKLPIYLDHNATTPCDPAVLEVMLPYFKEHFGNAASRHHAYGWRAEEAVELAREQVSHLVSCEPKEIIFTSGATESINLAIKGVFEMYASKGKHIITCKAEHKAVVDTCKKLEKEGADITWLGVANDGRINPEELIQAVRPDTILISVMYANNETGILQPVNAISEIAKKQNIIFFCDATQATGKTPVHVINDGIDLMSFSSHKMYGPKGVGALYVRRRNPRVRLVAQIDGGGHERGLRSGTLNVPGIAGFGKACELCLQRLDEDAERLSSLRDRMEKSFLEIGETQVNGSAKFRLPHVTNMSFKYVDGEALMMGLNKEIAVSSGSACTSASIEPSYVLKAMGIEDNLAFSSIRFALGRFTTGEEIDYAIKKVSETVNNLKQMSRMNF